MTRYLWTFLFFGVVGTILAYASLMAVTWDFRYSLVSGVVIGFIAGNVCGLVEFISN